ncbi:MAG: four-helix bundle copper-binding protein [Bacteroidota bacterium]
MITSEICIDACLSASTACEICFTDSINTDNKDCMPICRDTADISAMCARFEARGSLYATDLHVLCAKVCRACAEECLKHSDHHECCKDCAAACLKCAEMCEAHALVKIN